MPRVSFQFLHRKSAFFKELGAYVHFLYRYVRLRGYRWFAKFESIKDILVDFLYKRRGKYARPFLHFGTIAITFLMITFGPFIIQQRKTAETETAQGGAVIGSAFSYGSDLSTVLSSDVQKYRNGEVTIHVVEPNETLSSIAQKYGLNDIHTIMWENDLADGEPLKPGQELRILPIDGIRHKVARGETIYTIAKLYGLDENQAQAIVDYPFNEFKNDETFELAVGETIMVPGGTKQQENNNTINTSSAPVAEQIATQKPLALTPSAGTVTAFGSFVWPASGRITQYFSFFHNGFDIANHDGGRILAADSGTVIWAGWDTTGYGNKVMVDHGNGFVTLYGHLSQILVRVGQTVARGSLLGMMGSTGHSTGTHLHFTILHGGIAENPGRYLK